MSARPTDDPAPFALSVDDVFDQAGGRRTFISGRVEAGSIRDGMRAEFRRPDGSTLQLTILEVWSGSHHIGTAEAGDKVGLAVDVAAADIAFARGSEVRTPQRQAWQSPKAGWARSQDGGVMTQGRFSSKVVVVIAAAGTAWYGTSLVAAAWQACDDISAGRGWGLTFFVLPLLFGLALAGATGGLYIGRSLPPLGRLPLALIGVLLMVSIGMASQVPIYGDDVWQGQAGSRPTCGPGGIPTWWPEWLPS